MSVHIMDVVWHSTLAGNDQKVALALADHAHDDGTHVFPTVGYVMWKCNMGRRSVQTCLRKLEGMGILVPEVRSKGRRPTVYRIIEARIPQKPPYRPDDSEGNRAEDAPLDDENRATTAPLNRATTAPLDANRAKHDIQPRKTRHPTAQPLRPESPYESSNETEENTRAHARTDDTPVPAESSNEFLSWLISPSHDEWRRHNNIRGTTPMHVMQLAYLRWREEQKRKGEDLWPPLPPDDTDMARTSMAALSASTKPLRRSAARTAAGSSKREAS